MDAYSMKNLDTNSEIVFKEGETWAFFKNGEIASRRQMLDFFIKKSEYEIRSTQEINNEEEVEEVDGFESEEELYNVLLD